VDGEAELITRLRAGDEAAFAELVDRYHAPLLRLAMTFVPSAAVAQEVVQDTWIGVIRGIDRFEGRSSLKTWLFRILGNRARTAGVRERRTRPPDVGPDEPAVQPHRFGKNGQWVDPPTPWDDAVDDRLVAGALSGRIEAALATLPDAQRQVVTMRDLEGLPSADVCAVLDITEGNQRVLLHRGRSRLRAVLEQEVAG
jgi:RNA polymerase sigma-70 factor (ECF subfamily)